MADVIISTGGSGGHVAPAVAVYTQLIKHNIDVCIFVDQRGYKFCSHVPEIVIVPTINLSVKSIMKDYPKHIWTISKNIYKHKPKIVIGFGSISSVFTILMGKIFRAYTIIHEQNKIAGRANILLAKIASKTITSFPNTLNIVGTCLGNPIYLRTNNTLIIPTSFEKKFCICITGGSQGANNLTEMIVNGITSLDIKIRQNIAIIQQVASKQITHIKAQYDTAGIESLVVDFIHDMKSVINCTSLAICRSGASTIFEFASYGIPMILIPYPHASQDHQKRNAEYMANKNAAIMINEIECDSLRLQQEITNIIADHHMFIRMSNNAKHALCYSADVSIANICKNMLQYM